MEAVTTAISSITGVVTSLLTTITGNATLMLFFVAPIIGIGVGVLRKIKRV